MVRTEDFSPKNLTNEQVVSYQKVFSRDIISNGAERDALWETLDDFFADKNAGFDMQYYHTFFRWYTDLTWYSVTRLSPERFAALALGRQGFLAVLMGYDVIESIHWFLTQRSFTYDEATVWYTAIKEAWKTSEAYVGHFRDKDYTLIDIGMLLEELRTKPMTSVDRAARLSDLSQILSQPESIAQQYGMPALQPQEMIDALKEIHAFFAEVEVGDIPDVLTSFTYDSWFYEPDLPEKLPTKEQAQASVQVSSQPLVPKRKSTQKRTKKKRISYGDIRKMFRDSDSPEHIVSRLQELSDTHNDPSIMNLYYFDEEKGTFIWDKILLSNKS